jgi:hypothetical protein
MVDSTICPRCSWPARPGEISCAHCGAPLAASAQDEAHDGDPGVRQDTIRNSDPRDATGGEGDAGEAPPPQPSAASDEPEPLAPAVLPVHVPAGWPLDLRSMAEPPAAPRPREREPEPEPEPEPADDAKDHVPGGYLAPSAVYRGSGLAAPERGQAGPRERSAAPSMSLSIGAVPVTLARPGTLLRPGAEAPGPTPATVAPPIPAFVAAPAQEPLAEPSPDRSAAKPTATPAATPTATPPAMPSATPARKEPVQLVAFGLVASGGVLGIASFFLPWAGSTGIGIGTVAMAGSPSEVNQWAWGMPAAIPLFLLTGIVLAASAGSDRAQQRLPGLASVIGRVTDLILPMLLGGLYFGVSLLYVTLPPSYGFGTGIFVLSVAACLLVAGSMVALFFPPGDGSAAG